MNDERGVLAAIRVFRIAIGGFPCRRQFPVLLSLCRLQACEEANEMLWLLMWPIEAAFDAVNWLVTPLLLGVFWSSVLAHAAVWLWIRRFELLKRVTGAAEPWRLGCPAAVGERPPFAVVTGGSQGLGNQLVLRLRRLGYYVEVWDVAGPRPSGAGAGEACMRAGGSELSYKIVDVGDPSQVAAAAEALLRRGIVPDLLVLNAGIVTGKRIGAGMDLARTRKLFDVNVLQMFAVTNALMPAMVGNAVPEGTGSAAAAAWARGIVVVGSVAGFAGCAYVSDYNASKAAANIFAEGLAAEIREAKGPRPVQVTLVCPYRINTGMFDGAKDLTMMGLLREDDVADAVLRGVKLGQDRVVMPYWLMGFHCVKVLLPARFEGFLDTFFGASAACKDLGNAVDSKLAARKAE